MDQLADLQAQIIALRLATEGAWLSLLANDADPADQAAGLKTAHVAAIGQLNAGTADERAMVAAVTRHTEQLWSSIEWQLRNIAPPTTTA